MDKIKFLHCADIHLDAPFTSLGTKDNKSSTRRKDVREVFQKIRDIAYKEKIDCLLISGDLYEHDYIRRSTIDFINHSFKSIKDVRVFISPGNHDPWVKGSYYMNYSWADNVTILNKETPCVYLKEKNISIHLYEPELKHKIRANPHHINIMLAHGTVDLDINGKGYNLISSDELALFGMDYIALGHFHNRIDNVGGKGNIYNPGSPEPLGFDETGDHGIYMGTITKNKTGNLNVPSSLEVEFRILNKRYYEEIKVDITGCSSDGQVISQILYKIKELYPDLSSIDLSSILLNVILYGYIDPNYNPEPDPSPDSNPDLDSNLSLYSSLYSDSYLNLDLSLDTNLNSNVNVDIEDIRSSFKNSLFYIKINNQGISEYDFNLIKKEPGLKGLFTRRVLELVDKAQNLEDKELLMKSLYYGIQALEKGRVDIV